MSDLSKSKTLKWYDWDGVGEIPSGVKGVIDRDGTEWKSYEDWVWELGTDWIHSGLEEDIIAYTLGELMEVDCD